MRKRRLMIFLFVVVVFKSGITYASDPLEGPDELAPTMVTLTDIMNRISTGTAAGDQTLSPSAGPGPAMYTLQEIYDALPGGSTTTATAEDVIDGKTFITRNGGEMTFSTGTMPPSRVPKTGHTDCWDTDGNPIPGEGTGQDGDHQAGVEWPVPRFTDNDDGTVTDNLTGLIWTKNANPTGTETWDDALNYCNNLADGQAGLTDGSSEGDWRLPNVRELLSLIHYGKYNPALSDTDGTGHWSEGDPFNDVISERYWSSTTDQDVPGSYACSVSFDFGLIAHPTKSSTKYVWPVRGGQ